VFKKIVFAALALVALQTSFVMCRNITKYNFPGEVAQKAHQLASSVGNELLATKIKEDPLHLPENVFLLIDSLGAESLDEKASGLLVVFCDLIYRDLYPSVLLSQKELSEALDAVYFGEYGRNISVVRLWLLIAEAEKLKVLGDFSGLTRLTPRIARELLSNRAFREMNRKIQELYIDDYKVRWNFLSRVFSRKSFNSLVSLLSLGFSFSFLATLVFFSAQNFALAADRTQHLRLLVALCQDRGEGERQRERGRRAGGGGFSDGHQAGGRGPIIQEVDSEYDEEGQGASAGGRCGGGIDC